MASCASFVSQQSDVKLMARELAAISGAELPRFGFVSCTAGVDVEGLRTALAAALPRVPFIGVTSCRAVIGDGKLARGPVAASVLWLLGDDVRASVVGQPIAVADESRGQQLGQKALSALGSEGSFAVLHATPGTEEPLLRGLAKALGKTPLLGGSAADDTIEGRWSVFTHDACYPAGAVLAVVKWPGKALAPWISGAMPAKQKAVVTKAEGRTIQELDGKPAALVYNEWLGGALTEALTSGEQILSKTTLSPLGVVRPSGITLVHPERIVGGKALASFAEVNVGEKVALVRSTTLAMQGRPTNLVARAMAEAGLSELKAAFLVYCAGCMLAIDPATGAMVDALKTVTRKAPLMGAFYFGEQGCHSPGVPEHGNLMTAVLLLG